MLAATLAVAASPVPAGAQSAPAAPIPQMAAPGPATFSGHPAIPAPLYAPRVPQNPFMAPNDRAEIHNDAYQSDVNRRSGPLGRDLQLASTLQAGVCGSVTFDRQGRILSICVRSGGPTLYMFDPRTLATLATYALPPKRPGSSSTNPFQDFTGGGYFYLDDQDRVVVGTTTLHVMVIAETPGPGFTLAHDYDISSRLDPTDRLTSVLPDWHGRLWAESFNGTLVTIDPASGATRALPLGEETENSFATDETGAVYVVSVKALYALRAAADGTPMVVWRTVYPNSAIHEPGQVDAGSGTTPTVQDGFVSITDNADPLDIAVYRRGDGSRVCVQPIFSKGATADENSIIGAGHIMIAENNYGYTGPTATAGGATTAPGMERVDIDGDGRGCHVVWINTTEHIPTVVSKLSLASGLIYTYTKDDPSPQDPWAFTALDVRTGRVVYQQVTGTGLAFNNNYAPVTLGPDGTAYVGMLGGLMAIRDATPPDLPEPTAPGAGAPGSAPAPRASTRGLHLVLRRLAHHRLRAAVTGPAVATVTGVRFVLRLDGRRRVRTRRRRPFAVTVALAGRPGVVRVKVSALVRRRHHPPVHLQRAAFL